ncbi:sugar transferase [Georgenia yuyongxinii]|uniref:Sugar transferase n=1 Tax=Georgenia yuyongxinii TaxID=2589797 RepID=A0A552WQE4_9MICO|nr:sugar transferase [Georgenia yuyongxinii]TRW45008.1 sugar transferase [Georgenia yuyongxinii]
MAVTVEQRELLPLSPRAWRSRTWHVPGHRTTAGAVGLWRTWAPAYRLLAVAQDVLLTAAGVAVVCGPTLPAAAVVAVAAATAALLVGLIALHHGYAGETAANGPREFTAIFRGGTILAGVALAAAYVADVALPRPLLLGALPLTLAAIAAGRAAQRSVVRRRRRHGRLMRPALVVGGREHVEPLLQALAEGTEYGLEPIGICTTAADDAPWPLPVLGDIACLRQALTESRAEVVIVASASVSAAELRELSWLLEGAGVQFIVAPNLLEVGMPRISMQPTAGMALLSVTIGASRRRLATKAVLDRVAGALLLLAASVVLVPAALAVKVTSPGPAFYRQTRIGSDGQPFTMFKLRSMTTDADTRLADLVQHSDGNGTLFKMRQDPRVTPVGKFLRRYSVDELPQLINVVRGEMSLVGPRPPLPREAETYDAAAARRLRVKPGLTGLWQVSGRSDLSWEQSVRLDLRYVDNWSVPMDLAILGRTLGAVFGGKGAY